MGRDDGLVSSVLTALGTLGAVVLAGYLLGRFRVLGEHAATVLARVVFTVAIPALLIVTVGRADLHVVLSRTAAVTAVSTAIVVVGVAVVVRGLWRRPAGEATIATLGASYVNAAHLGLPLAVFLFGDAVYVVPTMLFQLLILAPLAFTILDADVARDAEGRRRRPVAAARATAARVVRNPIIVATATGLVLAALPWKPPDVWFGPFELVGAAAAPLALLVFGSTLAVPRTLGAEAPRRDVWFASIAKSVVHPGVAALVGLAFGLDRFGLLVVTAMAALPTAQNVLVYALQYGRGQALARDVGLWSTVLLVPALLVISAALA